MARARSLVASQDFFQVVGETAAGFAIVHRVGHGKLLFFTFTFVRGFQQDNLSPRMVKKKCSRMIAQIRNFRYSSLGGEQFLFQRRKNI